MVKRSLYTTSTPTSPLVSSRKWKILRFAKQTRVKPSLHIGNYTEQEVETSFYTRDELRGMREDIRLTASLIEEGGHIDERHFSQHGIERFTTAGEQVRKRCKARALRAVVVQQEYSSDELQIAEVYSSRTHESLARAQSRAKAIAAEDMLCSLFSKSHQNSKTSNGTATMILTASPSTIPKEWFKTLFFQQPELCSM